MSERGKVLAMACAAAMVCAGVVKAGEPVTIRHGAIQAINDFGTLLYYKQDVLHHCGKSYVIEPVRFAGTSEELIALAAGEIEIITIAYSSFGAAVQNAHLDDIRVIGDGLRDGVGDHVSSPYFVRSDGAMRTIDDMKGKIMAVNQRGSAVDIGGRAMLLARHLRADKDYTVIETPFPTMAAILLDGKADLIATTPPFSYDARLAGKTRLLFSLQQSMGESEMIVDAARAPFLAEAGPAMVDYFEDVIRFSHWMLDPTNRQEAVALAANVSKQPIEQIEGYYLTDKDVYHAPDDIPDLTAFQRNIDTQRQLGLLKDPIDVTKYADLAYVQEAAKRYAAAP